MKNINAKKTLYVGLLGAIMLVFVSFTPMASAKSDNNSSSKLPKIYTVTERTNNLVVLPVKYRKFRNETTTAIVSVKNVSTREIVERSFKVSFDNRGITSIKVGDLKPGTRYAFKVRLMKLNSERTTDNSQSRKAKTL